MVVKTRRLEAEEWLQCPEHGAKTGASSCPQTPLLPPASLPCEGMLEAWGVVGNWGRTLPWDAWQHRLHLLRSGIPSSNCMLAVLLSLSHISADWPLQSDYNTEEMACHLHHFKILFPMLSPALFKLLPAILSSFPGSFGLTQSATLSFLKITDPLVLLTVFSI